MGNKVQTVKEWADELGMKRATIFQRIQRGWTPEQALVSTIYTPNGKQTPKVNNEKENTPVEYTDTPAYQHDTSNPVHLVLAHLTERLNEQSRQIAELHSRLEEADQITSEEFGLQVLQHIMSSMPAIQAEAAKAARKGRAK